MIGKDDSVREETDASLRAERQGADDELARRVVGADLEADKVLALARERAHRLLEAARVAADERLPLREQADAAVALLLQERHDEDERLASERERADAALENERRERREKLASLLLLDRQATDLSLSLERRTADRAILARDDFLAQASHDVRGLMAAQKLYLALLLKQSDDSEHARRIAPQLAALSMLEAQMDRLISDLVDIVAIEAGKLGVVPRAHSAAELLNTATVMFEPVASERGHSLSVVPAVDVTVRADPVRAVQVLGNLLSNAIKFTPPNGKIGAGFEVGDGEVVFFVADSGPGVPAERAGRLFERFFSAGSSSTGLGLGLFIAHRLVGAHGGRLWLDQAATSGAVFRFSLPRA